MDRSGGTKGGFDTFATKMWAPLMDLFGPDQATAKQLPKAAIQLLLREHRLSSSFTSNAASPDHKREFSERSVAA